jgi:hypothetical protein
MDAAVCAVTARVHPVLSVGLDDHADGTLFMCLELYSLDN